MNYAGAFFVIICSITAKAHVMALNLNKPLL